MEKVQLREEVVDGQQLRFYKSSGKVFWPIFLPMVGITCFVGCVCALLLMLALDFGFYFIIATPAILSLPVLGLGYLTIRWGRCRNSTVGALIGLIMGFSFMGMYYIEGWLLHQLFEDAPQAIRDAGGSNTPWGYFVYVASITTLDSVSSSSAESPTSGHMIFSLFFSSIELLGCMLAGLLLGLLGSNRLFYENHKRWGDTTTLFFDPEMIDEVYNSILRNDWSKLSAVPMITTNPNPQGPHAYLKMEYMKDRPGPLFLTLAAMNVKKSETMKCLEEGKGSITQYLFNQLYIPEEEYVYFADLFPDLGIVLTQAEPVKRSSSTGPIEEC